MPVVKRDPLDFMQPFLGGHTAFDIDLENVPPATSVADANNGFSARAGAAILYAANTSLPVDANGLQTNEQDYGFKILAKMAYADYFLGPDQVPGRPSPITLRDEANRSIEIQKPGLVGSSIDVDKDPVHIHSHREYDVLLTAYVKLYYRYYHLLSDTARDNLFNNLLSQRGSYDPGEHLSFTIDSAGIGLLSIPETENHRLMIQSAKYLTNQLYFQESVSVGHPDHGNFDNNRNGNGGSNPPMVDVILRTLNAYLTLDFVEYNARPYQDYTMSALLNLASYSYDDRVRLAARMVLDYVSAKVAVSSQDLRRSTPFRRRNEAQHFGPTMANGFLSSPLVYNSGSLPFEPDPQIAFYTVLAGNTGALQSPEALPFPNPAKGHAPVNYAFAMVHAGLSDYRVPPAILDLFVSGTASRTFCQGFHHSAGINERANFPGESPFWYVNELYAGSPSYLISAGGTPSFYAYTANIAGVSHPGNAEDLGVAVPTTFIPSSGSRPRTLGFGMSLTDVIQFGTVSAEHDTVHLGVAPNFACGGPMYVPDAFEPAKHVGDPTLVSDGNWTFVDRGSDGPRAPGYYLAIFRVLDLSRGGDWGFLEAFDTLLNFHDLSFKEFQQAVKSANPSMQVLLGNDRINTYITQANQQIQFTVSPHSAVVSTTAEPDQSVYTKTFAHGTVVNSGQVGSVFTAGSGLITISNPAFGTITLDMHAEAADGDPLFGMHHPSRTSETGEVERAGRNQEVWVDSNYPGTGVTAGDFGDPFRTLGQAISGVAVGGVIRIINVKGPENVPVVYTKRMTLRAAGAPVTLPR